MFGGPATFQELLANALEKRSVSIEYDEAHFQTGTMLLINASRHLGSILKLKRQGVRIVQRLGSPTNYTRHLALPFTRHLKIRLAQAYTAWLRRHVADAIVYQSQFVLGEWHAAHGKATKPEFVIHNGVDTTYFSHQGEKYKSPCDICIISVEGHQGIDPDDIALNLIKELVDGGVNAELLMLGSPWHDVQERMARYPFVRFLGHVDRRTIPYYLRGADVFISTDVIAGCPNSVLESLACGTPVIGYNVGVLRELIEGAAGACVDAEGDRWKGQAPGNIAALSKAALGVASHREKHRSAARDLAVRRYSIDSTADRYYQTLFRRE